MFPYEPNFNPQKQKPAISVCGLRQLIVGHSCPIKQCQCSTRMYSITVAPQSTQSSNVCFLTVTISWRGPTHRNGRFLFLGVKIWFIWEQKAAVTTLWGDHKQQTELSKREKWLVQVSTYKVIEWITTILRIFLKIQTNVKLFLKSHRIWIRIQIRDRIRNSLKSRFRIRKNHSGSTTLIGGPAYGRGRGLSV